MKVLNISTDHNLLSTGDGPPNDSQVRHRLYGALVDRLDIIVLCKYPERGGMVNLAENVRVFPASGRFRPTALRAACRLGAVLHRETGYDCVTVQDPFKCGYVGLHLKRKCGLPLNVQVHAEFLDNPHWIAGNLSRRLLNHYGKKTLQKADTVRVGTTRQKLRYASKMNIPEKDIFFLPVLVKADLFQKESESGLKEKRFACGDKKVLLYAGRFERQKNLGMMLDVIEELKSKRTDFLLAMLGEGPDEDQFKGEIRKRNLGTVTRFFGFIERDRVAEYFLAADLLILTSLFEGTCRVLVEAAFAARPVVTTDIAGADDMVVDGETGFVVKVNDGRTFAEKISMLLDSEGLRKKMGSAARTHMTRFFDEEKFLNGLLDMWRATAAKGQS